MQKKIKYAIFKTNWGYFGLAGTEYALLRTHLPCPKPDEIKKKLGKYLPGAQPYKTYFNQLQKQITAYFAGNCVDFALDIPIVLNSLAGFSASVLSACRKIKFGQTISYGGLAENAGRPAAARAVGSTLAKNPLPLLIPCHRVLRSDGTLGGFSAPGGKMLKAKLLEHERTALVNCSS